MKKIAAKKYAQALFWALKEKEEKETADIVRNFINLLRQNQQWRLRSKILKELENCFNQTQKTVKADLISSELLNQEIKFKLTDLINELCQSRKVEFEEKIDARLISGFIIKFQDYLIDASLKKRLEMLKNQIN